jgi:hypothetical protein
MRACMCVMLLFSLLFLAGCAQTESGQTIEGSGEVATERRPVEDFSSVVLNGIGDLVVRQGDAAQLTVQAEGNLLPLIKTEVKDATLLITLQAPHPGDTINPTRDVRYDLTVKTLRGLTLNGAGRISADDVRLESVTVTINGGGTVSMSGRAERQTVFISGGQYRAPDLDSRQARVDVSGSGLATLWVRDSLGVKCTGGCVINHYGDPVVTKDITGGGAVARLSGK